MVKSKKKIALVGAPGSGKTTIASGLFYNLKILGKKVELVPELIKYKVYKDADFLQDGFDIQNTLEQKELEKTVSEAPGIEYVICEAPLCNGFFYAAFYKKKEEWPVLKKIAMKSMDSYDLIIFVEHVENNLDYENFGRKEDKTTSKKFQKFIKSKIKQLNPKAKIIKINQGTNIEKVVYTILDPQSYPSKKES